MPVGPPDNRKSNDEIFGLIGDQKKMILEP